MRETWSIFISPAILSKSWMIWVKEIAEDQLQFCMVRDIEYDGARCYDFAHTIFAETCYGSYIKMVQKVP